MISSGIPRKWPNSPPRRTACRVFSGGSRSRRGKAIFWSSGLPNLDEAPAGVRLADLIKVVKSPQRGDRRRPSVPLGSALRRIGRGPRPFVRRARAREQQRDPRDPLQDGRGPPASCDGSHRGRATGHERDAIGCYYRATRSSLRRDHDHRRFRRRTSSSPRATTPPSGAWQSSGPVDD